MWSWGLRGDVWDGGGLGCPGRFPSSGQLFSDDSNDDDFHEHEEREVIVRIVVPFLVQR